jgi:hypothetical protein
MKITFHGGNCCAVKHIKDMGSDPSEVLDALDNPKPKFGSEPDRMGSSVSSDKNFFYGTAPKEKAWQRLDRYLEYLDKVRPNGVIEIILCDYSAYLQYDCGPSPYDQTKKWPRLLKKRGFVLVTDCFNSNSKNRVFIFHRKKDKN